MVRHAVLADVSDQVLGRSLLNVNIDADFTAGQIERLIKSRNLGAGELRPGFDAGIQRADFLEGHFRNVPLPVRAAIHLAVMAEHQLAIRAGADIHLDEISAQPDGFFEGREGVFRVVQMLASMRNGDNLSWLGLGKLPRTELELRLVQSDPHKENLLQITALFRPPHGTQPNDRVWRTRCVQTYINLRGYLMGQTEVV